MAESSLIEWTDATWNPITGCSVVSPGCTNCYAMRLAGTRLQAHPSRAGLTRDSKAGPVWTGEVRFNEAWLTQPITWRSPRRIFVCAHADLFHEAVPNAWLDRVFAVMALAPQHTFQVLTKRAVRMRAYFALLPKRVRDMDCDAGLDHVDFPLPNVWLGVSAEDQRRADERVPELLATPAALRFVSAEPLLGPLDLRHIAPTDTGYINALCSSTGPNLDWLIAGGESGPGARPMHPDWARSLRDQCAAAGVPFHFKQWGSWLDEREATRLGYAPGPEMFDGERRPAGDRWHFYDQSDIVGGAMIRIGKKAAGRLLDGVEHNGMPEVAHA